MGIVGVSLFLLLLLSFGVKGRANKPNFYSQSKNMEVGGPFEASNSTSRYALTESIVSKGTFTFDASQAKFASPDVVVYQGKAFSIFTPGVSFVGVPFYYLGKLINLPQVTTYMATILFAIVNAFLVYILARKLGASKIGSYLSGGIFLFATNALPYAFGFTQHHFSLTVILLAILNATAKRTWINNILLGVLFGLALLFDVPNLIMLIPVGLYVLSKHFNFEGTKEKVKIKFKLGFFTIILGILPLILLFGAYNYQTTGSFTKIAQLLGRTAIKTTNVNQVQKASVYDKKLPFNTRNEVNGIYTLLISNERSWLWYCPVVLLGILGMYLGYKKRETRTLSILLGSVVATNIVVYSLFGDPWGGWAFGPRYLLPSAGILSALIAISLDRYKRRIGFCILFLVLLGYSIYISTLGMFTTSSIPPKQEAEALVSPIPYTYEYNKELAQVDSSKSYIYDSYLKDILNVNQLIALYFGVVLLLIALPYIKLWSGKKGDRIWI